MRKGNDMKVVRCNKIDRCIWFECPHYNPHERIEWRENRDTESPRFCSQWDECFVLSNEDDKLDEWIKVKVRCERIHTEK